MAAICFAARYSPGRMPPLLALLVTRPTANNAPGPTPWQLQENGYHRSKMTTLAALSLHFPFVWYGFLLLFGLALGSFTMW